MKCIRRVGGPRMEAGRCRMRAIHSWGKQRRISWVDLATGYRRIFNAAVSFIICRISAVHAGRHKSCWHLSSLDIFLYYLTLQKAIALYLRVISSINIEKEIKEFNSRQVLTEIRNMKVTRFFFFFKSLPSSVSRSKFCAINFQTIIYSFSYRNVYNVRGNSHS